MITLHKTIKRKWFDMIVSGEKKEEYLEIKKFWIQRLLKDVEVSIKSDITSYKDLANSIKWNDGMCSFDFIEYDTVTCRNGYNKDCPVVLWEHLNITVGEGKQEWGAEPGVKYFILHIGEIIKVS